MQDYLIGIVIKQVDQSSKLYENESFQDLNVTK